MLIYTFQVNKKGKKVAYTRENLHACRVWLFYLHGGKKNNRSIRHCRGNTPCPLDMLLFIMDTIYP